MYALDLAAPARADCRSGSLLAAALVVADRAAALHQGVPLGRAVAAVPEGHGGPVTAGHDDATRLTGCGSSSSTTTTASSSTWCSTSPSWVPTARCGATTRSGRTRPWRFDGVLLSPGPGTPERAGACIDIVRGCAGTVPVLGVCLGHQAIAAAYGGVVEQAPELLHGKTSAVLHDGAGVLAGLPSPFTATRYHSLAVRPGSLPRRAGGHRPDRGRGRDGAAPPRRRPRGCAVPPGVGADRGRPPAARELAGRPAATRTRSARADGPRAGRPQRLRARPRSTGTRVSVGVGVLSVGVGVGVGGRVGGAPRRRCRSPVDPSRRASPAPGRLGDDRARVAPRSVCSVRCGRCEAGVLDRRPRPGRLGHAGDVGHPVLAAGVADVDRGADGDRLALAGLDPPHRPLRVLRGHRRGVAQTLRLASRRAWDASSRLRPDDLRHAWSRPRRPRRSRRPCRPPRPRWPTRASGR